MTPFFFTPSVGGGIEVDAAEGVSTAFGVFECDSDGVSTFDVAATGGFRRTDVSFAGDSSLASSLTFLGSDIF